MEWNRYIKYKRVLGRKIYYKVGRFEAYEPMEDSFFILSFALKYAKGSVLDMGCGSGILTVFSALKRDVRKVISVDVLPSALKITKLNCLINKVGKNKVKVLKSDLFENVREKFDTILFNPPYLPDDGVNLGEEDRWTIGGKEGCELLLRFIEESPKFLKEEGSCIFLCSSLSNMSKILRKTFDTFERVYLLDTLIFGDGETLYALKVKNPLY